MSKIIKESVNEIKYVKKNGDESERKIIPFSNPITYIDALDVSELSDSDSDELKEALVSYTKYKNAFLKNMFTFELWLEHVGKNELIEKTKRRRFTVDNIEVK